MPPSRNLSGRLKESGARAPKKRTSPLWEGPEGEGVNGGISYSLLSRWLCCKERFRLYTVEGLRQSSSFYAPIEYGNMWHLCEEYWAKEVNGAFVSPSGRTSSLAFGPLKDYCQQLCRLYPTQQEQVNHWYGMCRAQFPLYIKHWESHPDQGNKTPLLQEYAFNVTYKLPSGRIIRLRGKWDSIDIVDGKLVIQENKTKSQINIPKLTHELSFDLQSMLYVTALSEKQSGKFFLPPYHAFWNRSNKKWRELPIAGIRYNVVRRSAHKSPESMVKKIQEDNKSGRISEWFARWNVGITERDIKKFRHEFLDPALECLCQWWDMVKAAETRKCSPFDLHNNYMHWRHPFGVYNVLDEGGSSEVDSYLESGSEVGLQRVENLFPELQEIEER